MVNEQNQEKDGGYRHIALIKRRRTAKQNGRKPNAMPKAHCNEDAENGEQQREHIGVRHHVKGAVEPGQRRIGAQRHADQRDRQGGRQREQIHDQTDGGSQIEIGQQADQIRHGDVPAKQEIDGLQKPAKLDLPGHIDTLIDQQRIVRVAQRKKTIEVSGKIKDGGQQRNFADCASVKAKNLAHGKRLHVQNNRLIIQNTCPSRKGQGKPTFL